MVFLQWNAFTINGFLQQLMEFFQQHPNWFFPKTMKLFPQHRQTTTEIANKHVNGSSGAASAHPRSMQRTSPRKQNGYGLGRASH